MNNIRILLLLGWALLTAFSAQAQKMVPHSFQYQAEAGEAGKLKELTQLSYPGTSSIRLFFEQVQLGPHSYLLLEGSDGAEQKLNAEALQNWHNSSAYFNGQNVKVSLYQAQGEAVSLKLKELKVNDKGGSQSAARQAKQASMAQARDGIEIDMPPWAAAVGRFTDGVEANGTGWIAANGAIVTDNRYGGNDFYYDPNSDKFPQDLGTYDLFNLGYDIIEFNVPLSNPDGSVNHPAPEDQYPLNVDESFYKIILGNRGGIHEGEMSIKSYNLYNGPGSGNGGYTIVEALPNSTGKRPGERIGEYLQVIRHSHGRAMDGQKMDIFHYGYIHAGGMANQTRQKISVNLKNPNHWLRRVDDKDRFLVYDTPVLIDNLWSNTIEGAPIVFTNANVAVGIHSQGSFYNREPSFGTGFRDQDFRKHLGEFFTTAVTYVDQNNLADESNGNIYLPYYTITEGVQHAADHDILNIARGFYNESVTINKPLKLSAPVGVVVIGAAGGAGSRMMKPNIPAAMFGDDASAAFDEEVDLLVEQASFKSYPNPFATHTDLHYQLTDESLVVVKVYNMLGQEVNTLLEAQQQEGQHAVSWDGKNKAGKSVPKGIYILQLKTGAETSTLKVVKQ